MNYEDVDKIRIMQCSPEEELSRLNELISLNRSDGSDAMAYAYSGAITVALFYVGDFDEAVRLIGELVSREDLVPHVGYSAISTERAVASVCRPEEHQVVIDLFEPAVHAWTPHQQLLWRKNTSVR